MNFEKYTQSKIYGFFDKLYVLFFANLIFTILTIAGLGLFSFMPALISLFIIIHSSCIDNEKVSLFTMFKIFIKEYIKSQKLFLGYLFIFGLLAYNTYYFYYAFSNPELTSVFYAICLYLTIFIDLLILISFIQTILIYLYFPHLSVMKTLKFSLVFSLSFIKQNVLLMILIMVFTLLSMMFFYLVPIIFVGAFALLVLLIYHKPIVKLVKDNVYLKASMY